jgi:hypothetical protein
MIPDRLALDGFLLSKKMQSVTVVGVVNKKKMSQTMHCWSFYTKNELNCKKGKITGCPV